MTQTIDAESLLPDSRQLSDRVAAELELPERGVLAVVELFADGATLPFIARYRKEATGGLDEEAIAGIQERHGFWVELTARKKTILESIHEQGLLTDELRRAILASDTRTGLEDLYLPYRPKRRTRAVMAKERGLLPLADRMWEQADRSGDPAQIASGFVDPEKDVEDAEAALRGARDILAERIVETAEWRTEIRELSWIEGFLQSKAARGKKDESSKFEDYYDFRQAVRELPGHRILAIRRGESEGFLSYRIGPDPDKAKARLKRRALKSDSIWSAQLRLACEDAYDRLLSAQVETDLRLELRGRADEDAVGVFASNLRELLLAPPFGSKGVLAIDPGLRTGCKVAILDSTGRLLEDGLVHPTVPRKDIQGTEAALDRWLSRHEIAAIAVGNGTGGRETFAVVRDYLAKRGLKLQAVLVNEAGASVYSASEVARQELPDHDVTVRGAVSIGRRLQDPLAELVKIDPKSIGVGQYQHDVDQKLLKGRLDTVVESCVNRVGVDLNTASVSLLGHVAGLGTKAARAIVERRDEKGPFANRKELLKVAGLGPKTFEQAAGFLRVKGGHPLDDSAVHPERYELVERIAADLGVSVVELVGRSERIATIDPDRYVDGEVGRYTLDDIVQELRKPGRDPRQEFEAVEFDESVHELEDLREGMALVGVVTNVTHFGAFVDVGVHQDGLVHVSQIANRFVRDPSDELRVGQKVRVKVLEVDLGRRRIALSIKALMERD